MTVFYGARDLLEITGSLSPCRRVKRRVLRSWRVAEIKTQMQIASDATPRWHRVLVAIELWVRRQDWRGAWRRIGPLLPLALALGLYAGTVLGAVW